MPTNQSQAKHRFRPERISTTEMAKADFAQSLGLSDVDDADRVEETDAEGQSESDAKFTIWDV